LDDVVIAGDHLAVLEALRILHEAAPGIGLHLKLKKCELIPTESHRMSRDLEKWQKKQTISDSWSRPDSQAPNRNDKKDKQHMTAGTADSCSPGISRSPKRINNKNK
jgi:hypothetical protein